MLLMLYVQRLETVAKEVLLTYLLQQFNQILG